MSAEIDIKSQHSMSATNVAHVLRATWAGLIVNILLSVLKFVAGVLGSSQAVIADAVHSLSDCTTDFAILIGIHYWSKPPDRD